MAATDITALVEQKKTNNTFHNLFEQHIYDIDVANSDFEGIETVATHNLVTIPEGKALVKGFAVVKDAVTSDGNATVQFKVGSDTLTGAVAKANLAAGDVIELSPNDADGTGGVAGYAAAAADTLDMTVGTAALTAGRFLLVLEFIDVATILAQGNV
jgi:hypothetical protein